MIYNATVQARWANPRVVNGKYQIDAEFKCTNDIDRKIAGMNMRMFYCSADFQHDASTMRFLNFHKDWRISNYQTLKGYLGNAASAGLFNFEAPAVAINCSIEGPYYLEDASAIPTINDWTRYFTLELTPKKPVGTGTFAPPLIWDKEQDESRGGFLPSEGLTLALCFSKANIKENGKFAYCNEDVVDQFNWTYNGNLTLPYGNPTPVHYV